MLVQRSRVEMEMEQQYNPLLQNVFIIVAKVASMLVRAWEHLAAPKKEGKPALPIQKQKF